MPRDVCTPETATMTLTNPRPNGLAGLGGNEGMLYASALALSQTFHA